MTEQAATCVPLCGATKAYGRFVKWWNHEPQCPVRVEHRRLVADAKKNL